MARSRTAILEMEKKAATPVIHDNLAEIRNGRAPIGLVYQKGGWFLHMLRSLVGADKFRDGMREYYRRFRDTNASTADLQRVLEETTGQDLDWFFAQWLRRGGSPRLEGTWTYDAASKRVIVEVAQKQPGDLFRLPLQIGISLPGAATTLSNDNLTGLTARFEISCEKEPEAVTLDPGTQLLIDAHLTKR